MLFGSLTRLTSCFSALIDLERKGELSRHPCENGESFSLFGNYSDTKAVVRCTYARLLEFHERRVNYARVNIVVEIEVCQFFFISPRRLTLSHNATIAL